jgi:hypothetical protein
MPAAPRPRRLRHLALALLTALTACALVTGCGGDKHVAPIVKGPILPPGTPDNTAPDSTVTRWLTAYTHKVEDVADSLLASNFRYHFSAQTDPVLVAQFGDDWGKPNETTSLHHLLHGFTNGTGTYVPGMTAMQFSLINPQVLDDINHPDSTAWYKRVMVSDLLLAIDVPTSGGTTTYNIVCPLDLYLVRGDAAVLSPGQSPSATRWYLQRCDDLSTPTAAVQPATAGDAPTPASATSWGHVRALYLQ